MIELDKQAFSSALPLLSRVPQAVLPYAVCEGINPGRIFVDRCDQPRIAFLWTPVGYYFLAGAPNRASDMVALAEVLRDIFIPASMERGETGFILIPSPELDKAQVMSLPSGREVIEIYRQPYALEIGHFAVRQRQMPAVPHGYRLQQIDAALAQACGVLASWASVDDFLAHGIGFALLSGDEVASVCWSVFASCQRVEIDVHTHPEHRRRGLACITASALIETCLRQGRTPNWECFWDNQPSNDLAIKLGFIPNPDYPVYYWEETPSR